MLVLLLIALLSGGAGAQLFGAGSTFTVEGDLFMLNGEPFRYISGSIHYFRIHPNQWNDRLQKIRAAGLNAIQFYIPWNFHEHHMDQFNFQGDRNFSRFLELAQQNNLYAFVRIGPYVCGEWENGGIPWWLLKEKDIDLRSADTRFLWATKAWWHNMLPHLRPHLLRNGGNVLMVQIENEYGSFHACDYEYMETIRDYARKYLGKETILYTTDGASEEMLKCGTIPGAMPTVDFGIASHKSIDHYFELLDHYRPPPPKVNSEFYPGWLVLWGQTTNIVPDIAGILNSSQYMWDKNASFNFYMMHGGTNFGFWNGAETTAPVSRSPGNRSTVFQVITSYDYTAPITEAGDITPKYLAIREWIGSLPNWTHTPLEVPQNSTKSAYGPFNVTRIGTPLQLKKFLTNKCVKSKYPMSFEELDSPYGFVLYETKLKVGGNSMLIEGIKDNGFMLLDGAFAGSFVSNFGNYSKHSVEIRMRPNQTVTILVENRGRQTYETINDFKGIIGNVTVNGQIVDDWEQCAIHMDDEVAQTIKNLRNPVIPTRCERFKGPEVYVGAFETPVPTDTFLLLPYWNKGSIFINGFNIGRYWQSAGPQLTLYVPKDILRPLNTIVIFELFNVEGCWGEVCSFKFVEAPIFNFIETPSQFGVRSGRTYKQNLIRRRTWNIKYPRWFGWD
ncbi:hypothetical protein L596_005306 [Steinernema carpocapsae]|uniref:Uncharacterized protein n=1 Tax=Steinernema carpocapsae TaxID=34508 RepID=A0A4U8UYP3_STECR|nr:hypothetical protein L596_005306 [Steinernema carpocapsae]